ncbi:hypothetical protein [Parabacteroides sp. AF17-3]|jgi:hypothetical protein|uniref:hypothetical protein n=1 Tax=Parabacteroides sp. AF17-3 TaxID=2293113 RepID=UPI001F3C46AB|nr:hypothetical protein [Parabacteroides sp. AF17-3]
MNLASDFLIFVFVFDEKATPYFAHGLLEFHEKAVTDVLAFLDQKQDCIVNLVMES